MSVSNRLQGQAEGLCEVLNNLVHNKTETLIPAATYNCGFDFIIHYVPTNFHHPLKDIVNLITSTFFLVSKQPNALESCQNDSDASIDLETTNMSPTIPEISIFTRQYVHVGTPISQKVHYLFQSKNFHESEMVKTRNFVDTNELESLNINDCRYIASIYIQCLKKQRNLPQMWLLCNQDGPQHISYLGIVPDDAINGTQKVRTIMIRCEDYDDKKSSQTLSNIKKQHMSQHQVKEIETHAYALYYLYGTTEKPEMTQSYISLEFLWNGVREIFRPPPSSSNAVMNIFANPEDVQSILPKISAELNQLGELFVKARHDFGKMDEVIGFDKMQQQKQVISFLDELQQQTLDWEGNENSTFNVTPNKLGFNISKGLDRQNTECGSNLDHSESLWLFLKDLASTSEMLFSLELIFEQMFFGNYQPVLDATNQTEIASLMKEIMSCTTEKERAGMKMKVRDACKDIQTVVDIGICKLQNDYVNFFIEQTLTTKDMLDYFTRKSVDQAERLQSLLKLHCVLSLVMLAASYAHIGHDGITTNSTSFFEVLYEP
ncbi:protein zwilch homolog [Xenia sp. Carnegie-2017]|uniref:protein zwilch homolog n=1 Tax=Xenia sp. Carnegie-2017 TaxID=2897299 RepID=UPI001F04B441|nr:protein zwilch homolog [Xenia sp. Carnegie-2017]